jgi:hypothetical protein
MTDELRDRLQAMNPEPLEDSSPDDLAAIFAVIEARRSTMTIDKVRNTGPTVARRSVWRRPVVAFAGMVLFVTLVGGGGVLLVGGAGQPAVDSAPTPTVPTTIPPVPTTIPPVPTSEMTWERVLYEESLDGTIWAFAHNETVLVAVGDDYNEDEGYNDTPNVVIWVSSDGRTWSRISDPAVFGGEGIQQAYKISAGPLGFVVSGEDVPNTVLWFSPDGYAWERILDDNLGAPGAVESLTVVAGGPGWIAFDDRPDPADPVFISDDGRNWSTASGDAYVDDLQRLLAESRGREPATTPRPEYSNIEWQYAWDGDRVVANQYAGNTMLWVSPNAGATWSRVDPDQPAFDVFPRPWLLATTQFHDLSIVAGNGIWIGSLPE